MLTLWQSLDGFWQLAVLMAAFLLLIIAAVGFGLWWFEGNPRRTISRGWHPLPRQDVFGMECSDGLYQQADLERKHQQVG